MIDIASVLMDEYNIVDMENKSDNNQTATGHADSFKVCFLGDKKVGKTHLVHHLAGKSYEAYSEA